MPVNLLDIALANEESLQSQILPFNMPITNYHECHTCNQKSFVPMLHCDNCAHNICESHVQKIDNKVLCPNCHDINVHECSMCEEIHYITWNSGNNMLCQTCEDNSSECERCHTVVPTDEIESDDCHTLCDSCYQNHYCRCDSCESIVHCDYTYSHGDSTYCEGCHDSCDDEDDSNSVDNVADHSTALISEGSSAILDYHENLPWTYHRHPIDNPKHLFGIELEIEHKNSQAINRTLKVVGRSLSDAAMAMHDGSLSSYGYEIVVCPHTYTDFRKRNWRQILKDLSNDGACSYDQEEDTSSCGLHIHLNRDMFKDERQTRQYQGLYYKLRHLLRPFSQRTASQIDSYCSFTQDSDERYSAVNLTPRRTVEVRLWRGTLNYDRFKSSIQMTFALLDFLNEYPMVDASLKLYPQAKTIRLFLDYVANNNRYAFLHKYLLKQKFITRFIQPTTLQKELENVCDSL